MSIVVIVDPEKYTRGKPNLERLWSWERFKAEGMGHRKPEAG